MIGPKNGNELGHKKHTINPTGNAQEETILFSRLWIWDCIPEMISVSRRFSCKREFLDSSNSITCQAFISISVSEQILELDLDGL